MQLYQEDSTSDEQEVTFEASHFQRLTLDDCRLRIAGNGGEF